MIRKEDNTPHWYVAYTRSCQEKKAAEMLGVMGCEYYLPIRKEVRKWSDRKKVIDRVVIPHHIFVRCLDRDRYIYSRDIPYIYGFMTECGTQFAAIVKDSDLDAFRNIIDGTDLKVEFSGEPLAEGDRVKVMGGALAGSVCELVSFKGKKCVAVRLGMIGALTVDVPLAYVQKIAK